MNKYKSYARLLSIVGLLLIVTGVTYSFFNYTRTGSANNFSVGRISFVSKNEQTITLNNLFPIDSTETGIMNDSTKVGTYSIEIKGDTDYEDGIEYLVSVVDANIYTSQGVTVPISLDVTVADLGTSNDNYFTARDNTNTSIYKKLVGDTLVGDQMLLVGYIKTNTTLGTAEGVDGSITIKAYLDENKILISDTYDGTESDNMGTPNSIAEGKTVITTQEWNSLNDISFKVKVEANEGIWVIGSLEEIMRKSAVMDNINSTYVDNETPGINFGEISSNTNGKGVYTRAGTESDAYPIMYYRGAVADNNVMFANKCWKTVRTTETNGVKLIYNGEPNQLYDYSDGTPLEENEYTIIQDDYGFAYNQDEKKFITTIPSGSSGLGYFSFSIPDGDGYYAKVEITGNNEANNSYYYLYVDSNYQYDYLNSFPYEKYWPLETLTSANRISFYDALSDAYYGPLTVKIQIIIIENLPVVGLGCDNKTTESQISLNINGVDTNSFRFSGNNLSNSLAYNGYTYNTPVYSTTNGSYESGSKFGNGVTWDGTNYTLINVRNTLGENYHYTCGTSNTTVCSSIRYYFSYYLSGNNIYRFYFTLTNGKTIENVVSESLENGMIESNVKKMVELWYSGNIDSSSATRIEDTIYCNDRSIYQLGGLNPNGGSLANTTSTNMIYSEYKRNYIDLNPSTKCFRPQDAFTKNSVNGNGLLDYPVGLITVDEIVMAGGATGKSNRTFFLANGESYWTMSPLNFGHAFGASYNYVDKYGSLIGTIVNSDYGLRPIISIKPGQLITKGTGTTTDPYVIE